MSRLAVAASFAALLLWSGSAQAILRETHPMTDQGEQIPGKTIKLNQESDRPPAVQKKKEAKTPTPDRTPRQATGKPSKDNQNNNANAAETGRAVGTMLDIGIGIGMGMGRGHRDDDRGGGFGGGLGGRMGGDR